MSATASQTWQTNAVIQLCDMKALREAAEFVSRGQAASGFGSFLRDIITDENGRNYIDILEILQELRTNNNMDEHKRILASFDPDILDIDSALPDDLVLALHEMRVRLFYMKNKCDEFYSSVYLNFTPGPGNPYRGCNMFVPSGSTPLADKKRLATVANKAARSGMKILEIGCFSGWGTTPILTNVAKTNDGEMWCVDTFGYSDLVQPMLNMTLKFYDLDGFVKVIKGDSAKVSDSFTDGYFDLIFVDGDHSYQGGKADLESWEPKVRPGGTFCGHDCSGYGDDFLIEQLRHDKDNPHQSQVSWFRNGKVEETTIHAGIVLALYERYGLDFELDPDYKIDPPRSVWSKTV